MESKARKKARKRREAKSELSLEEKFDVFMPSDHGVEKSKRKSILGEKQRSLEELVALKNSIPFKESALKNRLKKYSKNKDVREDRQSFKQWLEDL